MISFVLYLHSEFFLRITLLLVSYSDVVVPCALCTYLLLVFSGDDADLPLCFLQNSSTCILRRWRVFSCASRTSPTVIYAHLLLWYMHISVVLVHNANWFWQWSDPLVSNNILYLGTTSSWFMNLLSWLLLQLSVTSLISFISGWLYVTSSHLYGCALASLWYLQSWDFLFPCISWTLMHVYVTSSSCAWLFMSRSNLFQNFGLRMSLYFKLLDSVCLPIFRIIPKSLLGVQYQLRAGILMGIERGAALLRIVWHQHFGLPNN